ncbi:MAG: GNAT family N-acetyltransferase [Candidatus Micrarchaeota archaeon]|nr:GNAT family N-acetyltransferase [Candidatus Micrarchaeota archaeon]
MQISIREMSRDNAIEAFKIIRKVFPNSDVRINYNDVVLFAEKNGKPIGFIHFAELKDKISLKGIGVDNNRRGLGVGTKLMKEAVKLFESKCKPIYLKVQADNPAVNLYSKYGFTLQTFGSIYTLVKRTNN